DWIDRLVCLCLLGGIRRIARVGALGLDKVLGSVTTSGWRGARGTAGWPRRHRPGGEHPGDHRRPDRASRLALNRVPQARTGGRGGVLPWRDYLPFASSLPGSGSSPEKHASQCVLRSPPTASYTPASER